MITTFTPAFYTPAQIAKLLQVERQTVYGWIEAKKLAARKAGKMLRVSPEAIEAFLKNK